MTPRIKKNHYKKSYFPQNNNVIIYIITLIQYSYRLCKIKTAH